MAFYQFHKTQLIHAQIEEVWDFISSPNNLKDITPQYMGFEIKSKNLSEKMYPGMIIGYTIKPLLGIKMLWVTEITHVEEMKYFIDEQRIGPYSMWHHQHFLETTENGVLMTDIVSYSPPLGSLGVIANHLFITKQLNAIFGYREKALEKYFQLTKKKKGTELGKELSKKMLMI
jgi:ligand-binding SRPBCC domain-containing protein